ncbi:hypothetical protein ACY0IS_005177 [Escherichia coli]
MIRIEILFDRQSKNLKSGTLQALQHEIEQRLKPHYPEIWLHRPSERGTVNQHSIDSNDGKRGNLKIKPHTPRNFAGFTERDFFRSSFASSP